jgi:STE24 endopeptidase
VLRRIGPILVLVLSLLSGVCLCAREDLHRDVPPVDRPSGMTGRADEDTPVSVPEPDAKALRYYRTGNWLWVLGETWAILVPAAWLFTGASARLRDLARRLGRGWFSTVAIYAVLFLGINFVIGLPLRYYRGFVRPHAYGLSHQTLAKWSADHLTSLGVSMLMAVGILWIPYLLLARSPRRWWLITGLLAIPYFFSLALVVPIWYDPLFNHFGPMKDTRLESRILALAERAGITGGRVFEVDKSRDTDTLNAYVTGFLGTKRIVLWDTIIARLDEDELLAVMGHEMGHYVLGHVTRTILLLSICNLLGLYLLHRIGNWLVGRYPDRFGFDRLSDVASLPLFLLLIHVGSLLGTPPAYAYSRWQEHEADRFALEITRENHAAASAFVKFQEDNLSNPRPGLPFTLWRATHPSLGERIDFCNQYHPWATGEPLIYGHLFRNGVEPVR